VNGRFGAIVLSAQIDTRDVDTLGEPHDQGQRDVRVHQGARFDHAYYRDRHMPMVKARLGSACAYYTVEKGLAGRAPGAPPSFVAMCAFICDSAEGYLAAMQEHGAEIRGDIANYTDIPPVIQFSEVVVERSDR
jgi:uncharacterized protein (TIGR02118 family)